MDTSSLAKPVRLKISLWRLEKPDKRTWIVFDRAHRTRHKLERINLMPTAIDKARFPVRQNQSAGTSAGVHYRSHNLQNHY